MLCFNKDLLQECDKKENLAVSVAAATASCLKRKTVKRSVQCHVFAQPPPSRRPNDKYPVNTSHCPDLCKTVSLQCYLVATVIHIQSDVCLYTHIPHNIEMMVG